MIEGFDRQLDRLTPILPGVLIAWLIWIAAWVLGCWDLIPFGGPVSAVLIGIAGGLAWRSRRGRRWVAGVALVIAAFIIIVMCTPIAQTLARSLVRRDPFPASSGRIADAVVVLGAGVLETGLLNQEGIDRTITALRLLREGRAPALVVSRPAGALRLGRRPDRDWRNLVTLLPSVPDVYVLDSTETTRNEAAGVARLARERQWRRVIVVTSPLHTLRTCHTFERNGLSVICVPSESRDLALPHPSSGLERLAVFSMWLHEALGWELYRVRGWA